MYQDIFWAPTPRKWPNYANHTIIMIPKLHYFQMNSDLSFVDQKDCGHMQIDVDIRTPFETLTHSSSHILVSLPLMARWHSSDEFDTEQMPQQSGLFDYSAPQFFHKITNRHPDIIGPLSCYGLQLHCELERPKKSAAPSSALHIRLRHM